MKSFDLRAARRYAGALFNLALQRGEVDEVAQNLRQVGQLTDSSPQLMSVLTHPRITRQRKRELLRQLFAGSVRTDVGHFLDLLVAKDRAAIIPSVVQEYSRMLDEHRRQVDALVTTAVPITEEQRVALQRRLEAATGNTVRLKTQVDPALLGGLMVRVGDRLIDASVASRLQAIREQLKQVKVTS